jgi:hypothetical protein
MLTQEMRCFSSRFANPSKQEVATCSEKAELWPYVIPSVHGVGEAGPTFGALTSNGGLSMIILALPPNQAGQLVRASTDVRIHPMELQLRAKIPMRIGRSFYHVSG